MLVEVARLAEEYTATVCVLGSDDFLTHMFMQSGGTSSKTTWVTSDVAGACTNCSQRPPRFTSYLIIESFR